MRKNKQKRTKEEFNLELMQKQTNYNNWLYKQIKDDLTGHVLEIGCGIGTMTNLLLSDRKVTRITGLDIDKSNIELFKKNITSKKAIIKNINIENTTKNLGAYDSAVCINVLEHIKDDDRTIKNINKVLKKNGKLIMILPAIEKAYGTIDKADNHYRRYEKNKTRDLLKNSGFEINKLKYMNFPGLIGWIYHGKIKKIDVHEANDLSLYDKLVPVFEKIEKIITPLIGLSIVVVATKK